MRKEVVRCVQDVVGNKKFQNKFKYWKSKYIRRHLNNPDENFMEKKVIKKRSEVHFYIFVDLFSGFWGKMFNSIIRISCVTNWILLPKYLRHYAMLLSLLIVCPKKRLCLCFLFSLHILWVCAPPVLPP